MMKKIFMLIALLLPMLACGMFASPEPLQGSLAVAPAPIIKGSSVEFQVKISNPNDAPVENYRLIVGYSLEGDSDITQVADQPLNIEANATFEQSIPWVVDLEAQPNTKYIARLLVLTDSGSTALEASTPLEVAQLSISINIDQAQLTQGNQAVISVQVNNPSAVNIEGYMLSVGYGAENDASMVMITQAIPLTLSAGGNFSQEIPWTVDYVPASGNYEVRALITQSNVQIATAETPVTITLP